MKESSIEIINPKFFKALDWIVTIFTDNLIDYQLVGGVAAYFYGSKRQINDIDFYIDFKDLEKINSELKGYITQKPMYYKDENWNITFMKLLYKEQKIEIGDIHNCLIYDKKRKNWVKQTIDLQKYTEKNINNISIRIMNKEQLIEYKTILGREVDIQDVNNIII